MTSQSSTINIKRAGFTPLFNFTAKQCWTTVLLFTIILFFILPVPVLLIVSNRIIDSADDLIRLRNDFACDWTEVIRYFVIIAVSIFGIVSSCARFGYLKSKVSIDFYHSLPVKRRQLFLTQLTVALISLAIPYIFNIGFTLAVFAANGLISKTLMVNVLIMSAETFVYSTFFFALSTLVGMISGLGAVHLTLTAVAAYVIPVICLVSVAFVGGIFSENVWFDYYFNSVFFEKTTPALRFFLNSDPLNITESSILLLISAAMLIGSYAVYMIRKSERAGTPVVFPPLGEIIKYILVYIGTLCGGLLFYLMTEDRFWTVFGMACGMILVFMLTNTILNKTARAMFKGWKGLLIFAGVTAVAFIMFAANAFGINTSVPSPSFTSHIEVTFGYGNEELDFHDEDVITALHKIYTEGNKGYAYYGLSENSRYEIYSMNIVFYPKVGVPVAKSVSIRNKSDFIEEFITILDSEEFKAQYTTMFNRFAEYEKGHIHLWLPSYIFSDEEDGAIWHQSLSDSFEFERLDLSSTPAKTRALPEIVEANKDCGFDFFQQQSIGYMEVYNTYAYNSTYISLFTSMDKVIDRYISMGYLEYTPDKYLDHLADAIKSLKVYSDSKGDSMVITDKKQIRAILGATSDPLGYSSNVFTFVDNDYSIIYEIEVTEHTGKTYYNEYDGIVYVDGEEISTYTSEHTTAFLLGKVPGFVIEYFD